MTAMMMMMMMKRMRMKKRSNEGIEAVTHDRNLGIPSFVLFAKYQTAPSVFLFNVTSRDHVIFIFTLCCAENNDAASK